MRRIGFSARLRRSSGISTCISKPVHKHGLDHIKLIFRHACRDFRIIDVHQMKEVTACRTKRPFQEYSVNHPRSSRYGSWALFWIVVPIFDNHDSRTILFRDWSPKHIGILWYSAVPQEAVVVGMTRACVPHLDYLIPNTHHAGLFLTTLDRIYPRTIPIHFHPGHICLIC